MGLIQNFPSEQSYAVVAMAVACLLPYVFAILAKKTGGFDFKQDNHNPRAFFDKSTGLSARLNAVQANSFEGLPMFVGAVLIAMYCFVPQHIVNALAWFYVLLRVIYGVAYALDMATFRSVVWGLSLGACLLLFYFSWFML
ncbi:MAG: MAPEG family protein [Moraxella sp.]|nr:MAPEG family protein [Moraxella sp.]